MVRYPVKGDMASIVIKDGVPKKTFIPLENNPEVFAHLVRHLGVSPSLGFYDVYSIDEPSLLSLVPRPVYALLFTCPANVYHKARDAEDAAMENYNGNGKKEPVIWFRQTIGHACGLIALLHGIANGEAKQYVQEGSDMDKILEQAVFLDPTARADLLYKSQALEAAHMSAARIGASRAPPPDEHCGHHYICFVKADDEHLWELNGGMKGPVDRGALGPDDDALSARALQMGVGTFMQHAVEGDVEFSIVALAPAVE